MRRHIFGSLFLGTVFFAVGCTSPVTIEQPTEGVHTEPVQQFTVRFDKDFKPGTFAADLSGTTITHLFHPAPAPGGVSIASITYPQFMNFDYSNQVNGTGRPNEQLLRVSGESSSDGSCCDSATFSPPYTRIFRGGGTAVTFDRNLDVKERDTITATVFVDVVPKEALTVKVTGHPSVSLNEQPAGQDITLAIPSNDRRVDFRIRGIVISGEVFRIRAIADGYSSSMSGGSVRRAHLP